jgi:hypothetical protein
MKINLRFILHFSHLSLYLPQQNQHYEKNPTNHCPDDAHTRRNAGRPAVLNGNKFVYKNVNECGYGFSATFFPRFVVLRTITDWDTTGCFGAHSSFDGVYIKTKD